MSPKLQVRKAEAYARARSMLEGLGKGWMTHVWLGQMTTWQSEIVLRVLRGTLTIRFEPAATPDQRYRITLDANGVFLVHHTSTPVEAIQGIYRQLDSWCVTYNDLRAVVGQHWRNA